MRTWLALSMALILGADAQTLSWSYVLTDFPYLAASTTEQARLLDVACEDGIAVEARG